MTTAIAFKLDEILEISNEIDRLGAPDLVNILKGIFRGIDTTSVHLY